MSEGHQPPAGPVSLSAFAPLSGLLASKVLHNVFALIASKGTLVAFRLLILFLAAKIMGPAGFGRLVFLFAVVEIIRVVADFGTENYFLPQLTRQESALDQGKTLSRMAGFRLFSTFLGLIAYAAVVLLFDESGLDTIACLIGGLLPTSIAIGTSLTYYQANLTVVTAAKQIVLVAMPTLVVIAVASPFSATGLIALLVSFELVVALVMFLGVRRRTSVPLDSLRSHLRPSLVGTIARLSWPLVSAAMMAVMYTRLDVFVIKHLLGPAAIGLYGFAYRVSEPFRFVSSSIDSTLYSLLSRPQQMSRMSDVRFRRIILLCAGCYAAVFAVSSAFVGLFLASISFHEYKDGISALMVLSAALAPRCLNGALTAFQYALGNFAFIMRLAGVNLVLMGLLVYPFTKWLGITGAALVLLLVELWNTTAQLYYARIAVRGISKDRQGLAS